MASENEFHVPDLEVTDTLIERVQFSVSSRNAEAKICETVAHVFGSPMVVSPRAIDWNYITTGVVAVLRHKELVKKKYVWELNLCIYNIQHGVLVWKGKIPLDCNYTDVSETFHVLALEEGSGILGIVFQESKEAVGFHSTISSWIAEGLKDDKGRPPPEAPKLKFRKEMISKPCNFQHIQGSQAIDECIEIERIKAHILSSLASFKLKDSIDSDGSSGRQRTSSKNKRREPPKPKIPFKEIEAPATLVDRATESVDGGGTVDQLSNGTTPTSGGGGYEFHPTPPLSHTVVAPPPATLGAMAANTGGSDSSQGSWQLGRLSPLNLEDEITHAFTTSQQLLSTTATTS